MSNDNVEVTSGTSVDVVQENSSSVDVYADNTVVDAVKPSTLEVYPEEILVDLFTFAGTSILNPFTNTVEPPTPYNLVVTPAYSSVHLAWEFTEYSNHKHTEIFRSIINDRNTATLVGTATGRAFTDSTNANTTYYYWIRNVSLANEISNWNTTLGTSALTGQGESILETLQGTIDESKLTASLLARIDLTDINAAAITQEVSNREAAIVNEGNLRSTEISTAIGQEVINRDNAILAAANTQAANTAAIIASEREARITAEGAIASDVDTLSTTVDGNTTTLQTQGQSIDGLEAQYTVKIDNNGRVSGYGLASGPPQADGTESEFTVLADKFSILHPNATDPTNPELVFTVSGGKTVMDAAYIVNLTVTDADITSLSANKVTAGTMTAVDVHSATFKTSPSGGRVEVRDFDDSITVYNESNQIVAQMRSTSGGGGAIRAYGHNSDDIPIIADQQSISPAIWARGPTSLNSGVIYCVNEGTTAGTTAANFASGNNNSSYTKAYICTGGTAAGGARAFWAERGGYYDNSGVGYLPFTGCHDGLIHKSVNPVPGDLVVDVDVFAKKDVSDVICINDLSSSANQKGVIGVFKSKSPFMDSYVLSALSEIETSFDANGNEISRPVNNQGKVSVVQNTHDIITINSVGEGQINVCGQNGDIAIGDLIVASDKRGKGMKQSDDVVYSYTVAKAREAVTFNNPNEVKMIACIYLCG